MDFDSKILSAGMATISPGEVFVPLVTGVIPFAGIPVSSTGRPTVVLSTKAIQYKHMRPFLRTGQQPQPTHGMEMVFGPNILPVVVGQLMACAQVAGWDMEKLAVDLNAAEAAAKAQFGTVDPFTFGIRIQ